jgi:hypothetical protein
MADASFFGQTGRKLTWAWPSLLKEAFSLQKQERRHSSPKQSLPQEVQEYGIHSCKENFTCAEMAALEHDSLTISASCTALKPAPCGEQRWALSSMSLLSYVNFTSPFVGEVLATGGRGARAKNSRKIPEQFLDQNTTASFQILFILLAFDFPAIRRWLV